MILSQRRVLVGVLTMMLTATPVLHADDSAAQPATVAPPKPLSATQVMQWPMLWPDTVTTNTAFSAGPKDVPAGTRLKLQGLEHDGVLVYLPDSADLIMIPYDWSDLGAQAAANQLALPEDVRQLTIKDLVKRTDLLPDTVTLTTEVTLGNNKVLPEGTKMIVGRLQLAQGNQLGILVVDQEAQFNQHGGLDRAIFNAEFTDVIAQMRQQAIKPVSERKLRSSATLEGKLVDAKGNPLPEPPIKPKYYVVYYAAGWCGWCHKFTPTLIKFYEEMKASHPEVQVVYLSSDRTAEEMAANLEKSQMPWPAVAFDKRKEVLGLLTMAGPGTPQVTILTAEGQTIHDGNHGGGQGAEAALAALKRQLAKDKTASASASQ